MRRTNYLKKNFFHSFKFGTLQILAPGEFFSNCSTVATPLAITTVSCFHTSLTVYIPTDIKKPLFPCDFFAFLIDKYSLIASVANSNIYFEIFKDITTITDVISRLA